MIAAAYRLTGNLDLAEESAAECFAQAARDWPSSGVPRSVEAWLVTAARRRAIDRLRREAVRQDSARRLRAELHAELRADPEADPDSDPELDELRFLALCAGRGQDTETQVIMLLRYGLGVDTEALTELFHLKRATMAARLTRGKRQLQLASAQHHETTVEQMLPAVRRAIYLIFTLGQVPPTGRQEKDSLRLRHADFLSAVLVRHWSDADSCALRAMILIAAGQVSEAKRWLPRSGELSSFTVQAAIMVSHADPAGPDWLRIAELYDVLLDLEPNPTFALGRAVALGHAFSPAVGLADLDDLDARTDLGSYRYLHAARADCLHRLGRDQEAREAWARAAELSLNTSEADFFRARSLG